MSASFGRGLHAAPGRAVSLSAYDRYLGRWSRLTVPDLLAAAKIEQGHRVLDVASGTGEAAAMAIPIVGDTGFVVGADISLEMVKSARVRLDTHCTGRSTPTARLCHSRTGLSMPLYVSLACSSSPTRLRACRSSGASFEPAGWWRFASTPHQTGCPCGAIFGDALDRFLTPGTAQRPRDVMVACRSKCGWRGLFSDAGFQDIRVEQIRREGTIDGFDDYWAPIEEGVGQIPQTYHALDEADRRSVRRKSTHGWLNTRRADGKMTMAVEVLVGARQAG